MRRICVYCGSNTGSRPEYAQAARDLGATLARRGLDLVYGGAHRGLMGLLADAALAAGAKVTGVIPQALVDLEIAHHGLTDLCVVRSMHERKALMAELSDAFIALPGGFGTLEEFCEVVTWAQLGLHEKPHGLLNVAGFFDPFLAQLDHAVAERFILPAHRESVISADDPARLLDALAGVRPQKTKKWIDPRQT